MVKYFSQNCRNEVDNYRKHKGTTWTEFYLFFDPTPPRGKFLFPERGQKQTFLTPPPPPPPHLVHVVIDWPLKENTFV